MVVKAYPNPEDEYGEACCTAGVDDDDNWIRIWPIPFRDLRPDQKFKKWQWITATVRKSNDPRPESHELQPDTIVLGDVVDTKRAWTKRLAVLAPHYVKSVEELQEMQKNGAQTMGTIRPREVLAFVIEERDDPNWKAVQAAQLNQQGLFTAPKLALERIPYKFSYRFTCDDDKCKTIHKLQILDWEVAEAYRSWREVRTRRLGSRDALEVLAGASGQGPHLQFRQLHQIPRQIWDRRNRVPTKARATRRQLSERTTCQPAKI